MPYSLSGGLPQYDPDLGTGDGLSLGEWIDEYLTRSEIVGEVTALNLIDGDTRLDGEAVADAWENGLLNVSLADLPTDTAPSPLDLIVSAAVMSDGPWWVPTTTEIS